MRKSRIRNTVAGSSGVIRHSTPISPIPSDLCTNGKKVLEQTSKEHSDSTTLRCSSRRRRRVRDGLLAFGGQDIAESVADLKFLDDGAEAVCGEEGESQSYVVFGLLLTLLLRGGSTDS